MRKLPPDSEVAALKLCGMKAKEIAQRYGVQLGQVYKALRRWSDRKHVSSEEAKSPNVTPAFTRVDAQPVEHRDTGENVGGNQPVDTYRVRHTTLRDCGDLLREWGVGRSFA